MCQSFCTDGVAYKDGDVNRLDSEDINRLATELFNEGKDILDELPVQCGCAGLQEGTACDRDYDGDFKGKCDGVNNKCQEIICEPNERGCDDDYTPFLCNRLGTAYIELDSPCNPDTSYCSQGACLPRRCEPNDVVCYSDIANSQYFDGEDIFDFQEKIDILRYMTKEQVEPVYECSSRGSSYSGVARCSTCQEGLEFVMDSDGFNCRECGASDVGQTREDSKECLFVGEGRGVCDEPRPGIYKCVVPT